MEFFARPLDRVGTMKTSGERTNLSRSFGPLALETCLMAHYIVESADLIEYQFATQAEARAYAKALKAEGNFLFAWLITPNGRKLHLSRI